MSSKRFVRENMKGTHLRLSAKRKRNKGQNLIDWMKKAKAIKAAANGAEQEAASTGTGETSTEAITASAEARLTITDAGTVSTEAGETSTETATATAQAGAASTESEGASTESEGASTQARTASAQASREIRIVTNKKSLNIEGRRIINVDFFVKQLQKLNKHSKYGCNLNDMIVVSENQLDFLSSFTFRCRLCNFQEDVWTDEESVNSDTFMDGLFDTGCGYSNVQKLFAKMQLPTPSTHFEKKYRIRLAQEMKEAQKQELKAVKEMIKAKEQEMKEAKKQEMKAAKEMEKAKKKEMEKAKKKEMKEAKMQEMIAAQKRKSEASAIGSNNVTFSDEMKPLLEEIRNIGKAPVLGSNNVIFSDEMEPPVEEIRNAGEASESGITHPDEAVLVPELGEPRNTEQVAESRCRLEGTSAREEIIVPNQGMQAAGVTATAIQQMQNLVNVIGGTSSTTRYRISHVSEYSSAPYMTSTALAPAKTCEQRDAVYCRGCLSHITNYQDPQLQGNGRTASSTVPNQTAAGTSGSCSQMPLSLPAQSRASAKINSCLEALKSRMVEKKRAAEMVVRVAKEISQVVKVQASAKLQKEHELRTLEEARTREKAIRLNDAGERMFINDLQNRALSGIQRASSMEKYAEAALEQATNKLLVALETLVAAISREELALIELEKALAEVRNDAIVPCPSSGTRQTSDHRTSVTNVHPEESIPSELDVEQKGKHVIAGDTNSLNAEQKDKQGTPETENDAQSRIVIKEEIEIDESCSFEEALT